MKFLLAFALSVMCCLHLSSANDECDAFEVPEDPPTVSLKKVFSSQDNSNDRPRPDQKSLMIVFDTTGSMGDDLVYMREGARTVVNSFSSREDNSIFNYVLSLFNNPSEFH